LAGRRGPEATSVHGVVATTKLGSSQVCLISVNTGKVTSAPHSMVLFSR
jgi:hypothetical protein